MTETLHVVALSGGKDSTAMALRLRELNPSTEYVYVCTPTNDELDEMFEHWKALSGLLGGKLVPIFHPLGLAGLIKHYNALPNWRQRWCIRILKIEPYERWLQEQCGKYEVVSYVGIRADEPEREGGDYSAIQGVKTVFPMRDWGWTIDDVNGYLKLNSIEIPERTDCGCCFYQRLGEWRSLWQQHPDRYEQYAKLEDETGHTFRSPGRDTWPASLRELAKEFSAGRKVRGEGTALKEAQCRVCRM